MPRPSGWHGTHGRTHRSTHRSPAYLGGKADSPQALGDIQPTTEHPHVGGHAAGCVISTHVTLACAFALHRKGGDGCNQCKGRRTVCCRAPRHSLAFIACAVFLSQADIPCLPAAAMVLWWLWFAAGWAAGERGGRREGGMADTSFSDCRPPPRLRLLKQDIGRPV